MKLFIWNDPYSVYLGGSCLLVVAPDLETAKRKAIGLQPHEFGHPPAPRTEGWQSPLPAELGDPDFVFEAPAAFLYEWSE